MKTIITLLTLATFSVSVMAQNQMTINDSLNLKPSSFDQQYDYENHLTPFAPKKQNNWSIGVGVGTAAILGDMRSVWLKSTGVDLKIRKAFSHVFSLRWQSIYADMTGVDYRATNWNDQIVYLNYNTRMSDHTLQGVFTLNNINFHKRNPKVGFNVIVGAGFATSFTRSNLLDENGNAYDYSGLANIETYGDRRFVVNELINLMDDGFETTIEPKGSDPAIKDTRIMPSVVFGTGLDFRLSHRVDLALESRVSKHYSDMLDGYKKGDGDDWLLYMNVGLNFKIGKRAEPLYWTNPLDQVYTDVMELKAKGGPDNTISDIDQDGVNDMFDRDLNTPIGARVTVTGESMDSDNDGIPDFRDREVYSLKGAQVDQFGFALDSDMDGVPDVKDKEANTPQGAYVDVKGRAISAPSSAPQGVNNVYAIGSDLWSIFFASDDYTVTDEYDPIVLNLASYLLANPSARVLLTGYTDSQASNDYNMLLSKKRANSVLQKFIQVGIDSSRFDVNYLGEEQQLVDGTSSLAKALNRRVTLQLR